MTSKEFIESKQKASIKEKFKEGKMDEVTPEEVKPFNETIAKEIDRQRKRIGGNFLVVYATATQVDRNRIRKILPDCTFITLTLTREAQKKRLLARYDRGEYFTIIPLFWLRNSFGFLALFGKVFGRGNIVSPKKWKTFPKLLKKSKKGQC